MAKFANKFIYGGKMDMDSDPAMVKEGDYVYALSLRPYDAVGSAVGTGRNIPSNELVYYDFGIDESQLRCVGSRLDAVRKRVYWFVVAKTPSKAFILYYDYKSRNIKPVFNYSNILDFDTDTQIKDIDIIYDDEFGDTLMWSGKGEPRKLNVMAGENRFNNYKDSSPYAIGQYVFANYVNGNPFNDALLNIPFVATGNTNDEPEYNFSTGNYTNSDKWQMAGMNTCYPPQLFKTMFYQKPIAPWFSPNATYGYDSVSSSSALNILEKSYEFCYKYIYFDGQESEWSPKSEAVFPLGLTSLVFAYGGNVVGLDYKNVDHIKIRVPVNIFKAANQSTFIEQPHSMIARVLIAVREVPTKYTPGDWYQLANIPIEELYRHDISDSVISTNFPTPNTSGTYYYNWDSLSYFQDANPGKVVTITYKYDGKQALIPIDPVDANTLFYNVPKQARTQEVIVNRMVWGGVKNNMRVTKSVYDSIAQNLVVSVRSNKIEFNIEESNVEINNFTHFASSTSLINSNKTIRSVFDLSSPYVSGDYQTTFYYSIIFDIIVSKSGGYNQYNFGKEGSLFGGLSYAGYTNMEDFIADILITSFTPYSSDASLSISFNESTGQLTIDITLTNTEVFTATDTSVVVSTPYAFFKSFNPYPVRTIKNHSKQQVGLVFQDAAGRLTPVITGEWGGVDTGHYIDNTGNTLLSTIRVSNLKDINVPLDARIAHIVKRQSNSYRKFLAFSLSRGNCPEQSWNYIAPYWIGFLDLTLDEFDNSSFIDDPKNLYISLNSITGAAGAAYNILREQSSSLYALTPGNNRTGRKPRDGSSVYYGPRPDTPSMDRGEIITPFVPTENPELIEVDDISIRYTPSDGDAVRFLYRMGTSNDIVERYSQLFQITGYNEKWNTITLNWDEVQKKEPNLATYLLTNNPQAKLGGLDVRILAEIISKPEENQNGLYWECAAQLSCTNGKVDIDSTADYIDIFGDVYLKPRGNAISYVNGMFTPQNFNVEDMNYNDFYPSANCGEGRPNAEVDGIQKGLDYQSETTRSNLIVHSEKSVQNTDIRKYGTVYPENIQEVDNAFGGVEQIISEGDKITIYQEDKVCFAFLERSITKELSGSERVIASQNQVISDIVYYNYNAGISKNGTTFARNGYQAYYADEKRGMVYRQSMDGITPISEVGLSGEFAKIFTEITQGNLSPIIRGITLGQYNEYILHVNYSKVFEVEVYNVIVGYATFNLPDVLPDESRPVYFNQYRFYADVTGGTGYVPKPYNVYGRSGDSITFFHDDQSLQDGDTIKVEMLVSKVIVYSERTKGWSMFLPYSAEWASEGIQSYHTFVNGQMWVHPLNAENNSYNSFHGRDFPSELVLTDSSSETNRWLTIGVKTNLQPTAKPIDTSLEMLSNIPREVFRDKEGTYWGYFLRDENSNGGLYNGDYLKGRWVRVKLVWDSYEVNDEQLKVMGASFNREQSDFSI